MNEVQQFKDLMSAKSLAKQEALIAIGTLANATPGSKIAKDAQSIIEAKGNANGEEGQLFAQMQSLADNYVKEHPEIFSHLDEYANASKHEDLVKMIDAFNVIGLVDEAIKLTMFELVSFERQTIGAATQAVVRLVGNK